MGELYPLVSIITPTYNRASFLHETIQSVLTQDYSRIEYIVLDDGSTDSTREVLAMYSGRLIWERHANMGETRTVNKGFSMAKGEIVAVVNSDDPLLPGAVSEAVAFMQAHPDVLVAYPDWNEIGPDSKVIRHMQVREYDYLYMLRRHYCTPGPGAFIRRKTFELIGMRDPGFIYVADFEYWLRLGLYGKFARIPKTLAMWRTHPGSTLLSQRGKSMAHEHIRLIEKYYSNHELPAEVRKVRAEAYSWAYLMAAVICRSARREALKFLLRSILYHPQGYLLDFYSVASALSQILPKPIYNSLVKVWHTARPISATCRWVLRRIPEE